MADPALDLDDTLGGGFAEVRDTDRITPIIRPDTPKDFPDRNGRE